MLELAKVFNGGAEWVCGSSLAFGLLRNPVYTALLITALALVIIFAFLRPLKSHVGWRLGVKTGFWLLLAVSAVTFAHYYALEHHLRQASAQRGVREVVASIHHTATTGGGYQVYPSEPSEPSGPEEEARSYGRPNNVGVPEGESLVLEEVVLPSSQAPGVD